MHAFVLRNADPSDSLTQQWASHVPPSPFSGWEVFSEWMASRPKGAEPFVIMVTDSSGHLVAVAPWCIQRERSGLRRLTGLGGEDAWYHDPWILQPEHREAANRVLVDTLLANRRQWDALSLILRTELSGGLRDALAELGWFFEEKITWRQHQLIEMGEDWSAYWSTRPQGFRDIVKRKGKRLNAVPHRYHLASAHEAESYWEALFELQAKRMAGVRDWQAYHAALRVFCQAANRQGSLRLYALEINDQLAALELFICTGDRAFELTRAINDDFNYYSAGSLLTAWSFETLYQAGIRRIDPGPGHYSWKETLQTGILETVQTFAASPGSLVGMGVVGWNGVFLARLKRSSLIKRLYKRLMSQKIPKSTPLPT